MSEINTKFSSINSSITTMENDITSIETQLSSLTTKVNGLQNTILQAQNPVGTLRFQTTSTNPNSILGFGTWQLWGSGRVPVGINTGDTDFNTVEKTGGSKTHTNVLSYNDGAAAIRNYSDTLVFGDGAKNVSSMQSISTVWEFKHNADYNSSATYAGVGLYGKTGAGSSLPPYITCYIFKRIS